MAKTRSVLAPLWNMQLMNGTVTQDNKRQKVVEGHDHPCSERNERQGERERDRQTVRKKWVRERWEKRVGEGGEESEGRERGKSVRESGDKVRGSE